MICLKKASTNINNDRKGEASCLGTSKLLLAVGDLHVAVVSIGALSDEASTGVLLLLDSNV